MEEVLKELGVDYAALLRRFSGNAQILEKFLLKFPQDQTFPMLQKQVAEAAYAEVERSAHTLKGLSANLGFGQLSEQCAALVACIRNGEQEQATALFEKVRDEYTHIVERLAKLA